MVGLAWALVTWSFPRWLLPEKQECARHAREDRTRRPTNSVRALLGNAQVFNTDTIDSYLEQIKTGLEHKNNEFNSMDKFFMFVVLVTGGLIAPLYSRIVASESAESVEALFWTMIQIPFSMVGLTFFVPALVKDFLLRRHSSLVHLQTVLFGLRIEAINQRTPTQRLTTEPQVHAV